MASALRSAAWLCHPGRRMRIVCHWLPSSGRSRTRSSIRSQVGAVAGRSLIAASRLASRLSWLVEFSAVLQSVVAQAANAPINPLRMNFRMMVSLVFWGERKNRFGFWMSGLQVRGTQRLHDPGIGRWGRFDGRHGPAAALLPVAHEVVTRPVLDS